MKRLLQPSYAFNPSSQTLNLNGIANFSISGLIAVIDLTANAIIYAPGIPGFGYSNLNGTTLTLQASMSGLATTDALMIIYDDGLQMALESGGNLAAILQALKATLSAATPATAFVDRSGSTDPTPGTWDVVCAANAARQYLRVNNTGNAPIYIWDKTGTPNQAGAIAIQPGAGYVFDAKVSNTAIQSMSNSASVSFEAAEG